MRRTGAITSASLTALPLSRRAAAAVRLRLAALLLRLQPPPLRPRRRPRLPPLLRLERRLLYQFAQPVEHRPGVRRGRRRRGQRSCRRLVGHVIVLRASPARRACRDVPAPTSTYLPPPPPA